MSIQEVLNNPEISLEGRIQQGKALIRLRWAELAEEQRISSAIYHVITESGVINSGELVSSDDQLKKIVVADNVSKEAILKKRKKT